MELNNFNYQDILIEFHSNIYKISNRYNENEISDYFLGDEFLEIITNGYDIRQFRIDENTVLLRKVKLKITNGESTIIIRVF